MHATHQPGARVLASRTRDATVAGPQLREAHREIGRYLATEFVTRIIGLDAYAVPHVQGGQTDKFCLRAEAKTVVVAIMRGGEPMALGVSDAFPTAMFVHAGEPAHLKAEHLEGMQTVVLVDSVVNSGKSLAEFVNRVRPPRPHHQDRIRHWCGASQGSFGK